MDRKKCRRCGRDVLSGTSNGGRAAGVDVQLDLLELTPLGELDAAHDGRRTWTMHSNGDVHVRGPVAMLERPAGHALRQTVHADHRCEQGER